MPVKLSRDRARTGPDRSAAEIRGGRPPPRSCSCRSFPSTGWRPPRSSRSS